ncbi:transcriptional repressor [Flavobacterium sp. DG1-102-2]|uniref:Fur family transcriptional regulator n=1 Tax=Flavobacterium sp. DG1-102-2 TaxID=3081663 RepID=UPI0029497DDC|nr:transcriptional repressor [Flavobacterium sp. DG1-102-2]MDV6170379.1 transcriptional repressor [Flavobacterium sp. DG1-102-2]
MKRRNTPAKTAILTLLKDANAALSQEMIEADLKGEMDRVTIYRVLNSFCEDGITHKILADDGKYYFALCHSCNEHSHDHDHFHFKCTACQKVECLDEQVTVQLPIGYVQKSITSWVSGLCKNCAAWA